MADLTLEELAELRRNLAAANPGHWQSMRDGNQYVKTDYMPTAQLVGASRIDGPRRPWNPHAYLAHGFKPGEFEIVRFTDDVADLVAALVNAAPQLIATAERTAEAKVEPKAVYTADQIHGLIERAAKSWEQDRHPQARDRANTLRRWAEVFVPLDDPASKAPTSDAPAGHPCDLFHELWGYNGQGVYNKHRWIAAQALLEALLGNRDKES